MFDYVILVASLLGLVVNAAGLWMIGRRRKSRAFAKGRTALISYDVRNFFSHIWIAMFCPKYANTFYLITY